MYPLNNQWLYGEHCVKRQGSKDDHDIVPAPRGSQLSHQDRQLDKYGKYIVTSARRGQQKGWGNTEEGYLTSLEYQGRLPGGGEDV